MIMAGVPVVLQHCWLTFDHLKYLEASNGCMFLLVSVQPIELEAKGNEGFFKESCMLVHHQAPGLKVI